MSCETGPPGSQSQRVRRGEAGCRKRVHDGDKSDIITCRCQSMSHLERDESAERVTRQYVRAHWPDGTQRLQAFRGDDTRYCIARESRRTPETKARKTVGRQSTGVEIQVPAQQKNRRVAVCLRSRLLRVNRLNPSLLFHGARADARSLDLPRTIPMEASHPFPDGSGSAR